MVINKKAPHIGALPHSPNKSLTRWFYLRRLIFLLVGCFAVCFAAFPFAAVASNHCALLYCTNYKAYPHYYKFTGISASRCYKFLHIIAVLFRLNCTCKRSRPVLDLNCPMELIYNCLQIFLCLQLALRLRHLDSHKKNRNSCFAVHHQ